MDILSLAKAKQYADELKTEVDTQRQQDILKVTAIDKELNDFQKTLSMVNVNQEAKQTVTGYGVISLPKNAANGQISDVVIKGQTWENKLGTVVRDSSVDSNLTASRCVIDNNGQIKVTSSIQDIKTYNIIQGHKYFVKYKLKNSSIGRIDNYIKVQVSNAIVVKLGESNQLEAYGLWTATENYPNGYFYAVTGTTLGQLDLDYAFVYDLTEIYGTGKEPTEEWCNTNLYYISNTKSTICASRLKSVGKNLFDAYNKNFGNKNVSSFSVGSITDGVVGKSIYSISDLNTRCRAYFKGVIGKTYTISYPSRYTSVQFHFADNNGIITSIFLNRTFTVLDNRYILFSMKKVDGTSFTLAEIEELQANIQIVEGSVATPYEPHTESTQYVVAKDSNGNIVELRSLPNGTKDEVRVSGGKAELVKRVSSVRILNGSENWILSLDDANTLRVSLSAYITDGKFVGDDVTAFQIDVLPQKKIFVTDEEGIFINTNRSIFIRINKSKLPTQDLLGFKAWLQANPLKLTYQLATPIEMPIEVSGTLMSYPSGTIYIEPVVADAGVYDNGISVLNQGLPIKELEKLIKVDYLTGVETELDVSKAVIAGDKLSFTHPNLVNSEIVFFTYYHNTEGTQGEFTGTYYDSRHVLKDSVTGKFYKVVPTVANGVLTNGLVEV